MTLMNKGKKRRGTHKYPCLSAACPRSLRIRGGCSSGASRSSRGGCSSGASRSSRDGGRGGSCGSALGLRRLLLRFLSPLTCLVLLFLPLLFHLLLPLLPLLLHFPSAARSHA